jgi:hypothetical protein
MEKETPKEFCARILPVVKACADGEVVQVKKLNGWTDKEFASFLDDYQYRIKPKTHIVNRFEVPLGDTEFEIYEKYFYPALDLVDIVDWHRFGNDSIDRLFISLGIAFKTKEAAIANAKATLGIDPYGEDSE